MNFEFQVLIQNFNWNHSTKFHIPYDHFTKVITNLCSCIDLVLDLGFNLIDLLN
ncbi:hypothetical protein Hdeb2414_s0013g00405261 [Helianthus debilis subsp. tardiflorus]